MTADFVRFVRLVETLPQLDAQSTAMVCADVAEEIAQLDADTEWDDVGDAAATPDEPY